MCEEGWTEPTVLWHTCVLSGPGVYFHQTGSHLMMLEDGYLLLLEWCCVSSISAISVFKAGKELVQGVRERNAVADLYGAAFVVC